MRASPEWRRDADLVVVGSGAAGISVALTAAARGLRVLVVTKDLIGGATPLAQGGLAAAIGAGDTPQAHVADTLVAGAGLCEADVVAALADAAPGAIGWLTGLGARLETRDLRLEGGHSAHRIIHSGDDASGAEVHRALLSALLTSRIEVLDRTVVLDLLVSGTDGAGISVEARATSRTAAANAEPAGALAQGLVPARAEHAGGVAGERPVAGLLAGVIGADGGLTPGVISARAVVIAAGGLGQAFGTTSNPAGATGDGIAIAARAGAVIRDLEFVQFHPTVLWLPGASGQCPLITEALRGAGAVLRDLDGTPLMAGHDPRGDLAPRDVVAARMAEVIAAGDAGHVWLDATALGRDLLEGGFPTVTAACRKHGIDPVTDLIPVAPGAHYSCGGILADLDGRTTLPGLYAAGEAASTGVQGANRLASNSVTEAVIAGRRTGAAIADALSGAGRSPERGPGAHLVTVTAPAGGTAEQDRGSKLEAGRHELAQAMSRHAGVMRDADGLAELLRDIGDTGDVFGLNAQPASFVARGGRGNGGRQEKHATVLDGLDLDGVEAANLRTVSLLIAAGAARRAESRGCHRRRDAAGTAAAPWHTLARWDGRELIVTEEAATTGPGVTARNCGTSDNGGKIVIARADVTEDRRQGGLRAETLTALRAAGLAPEDVARAVRAALDEDFRYGADVTSTATVTGRRVTAEVVAREGGVIAGLPVALAVFDLLGDYVGNGQGRGRSEHFNEEAAGAGVPAPAIAPPASVTLLVADGARVSAGDAVLRVSGDAVAVLGAERTMLNFLTHLSGIASATRAWADAIAGTGAVVRDTRKTLPGLRGLQKYAVRCGGGENHRMGLGDAALVKDNHVAAAGGIEAAVRAVRAAARPGLVIEVECDSVAQVREALAAGARFILLDNMPVPVLREAVAVARAYDGVRLEASGGLQLSNAREVASTGVDYLAVGGLTHSSRALDLGLDDNGTA